MWLPNRIKGSLGAGVVPVEEAQPAQRRVSAAVLCFVVQEWRVTQRSGDNDSSWK